MPQKRNGYSKQQQDSDDASSRSEADDDFEYHVTFPQNKRASDTETEGELSEHSDAVQRLGGRKPTVVMLGWLGCQDRYLSKYTQIYEKNLVSLRICAQVRFFPSSVQMRRFAQKALDTLFDYECEKSPIVFHVFSNFGTMMLLNMMNIIKENSEAKQSTTAISRYQKLNIRGVIFDSTPGRPRFLSGYRALVSSVRTQSTVLRVAMKIGIFFLFLGQVVARWFVSRLQLVFGRHGSQRDSLLEFYSAMKNLQSPWRNEMYLFSRADELIDWHDVDELLRYRKEKLNMNVTSQCWADTDHVAHYRKYKDDYTKLCLDFVDRC